MPFLLAVFGHAAFVLRQGCPHDLVDGPRRALGGESYAKRDKYREPPVPQEVVTIAETLAYQQDDDEPLLDVAGQRVPRVRRAADELEEETGDRGWQYLDVHDLRRTWGTYLLEQGAIPSVVMSFGGRERLETTFGAASLSRRGGDSRVRGSSTSSRAAPRARRWSSRYDAAGLSPYSGLILSVTETDTNLLYTTYTYEHYPSHRRVKERLRDLKRDDESFNDLLDRLSRSEKDVEAIAESIPSVDEKEIEQMDEARERLNESLEDRR